MLLALGGATIINVSLNFREYSDVIFDVRNGETLQKTLNIGISKFPADGDTIWECIKFADTALYVAKTTVRNKIVEYTKEMSESATTSLFKVFAIYKIMLCLL